MTFERWINQPEVRYRHISPAQPGKTTSWPGWLPKNVIASINAAGIARPWIHQCELAELAHAGHHCAITTSTASGKSLAYLMPVLAALAGGEQASPPTSSQDLRTRLGLAQHSALYLSVTKALAHDQLRSACELAPKRLPIITLDGDSSPAQRRFARDEATFILTNPDMLHMSILPNHLRYRRLLSSLRYVIIDEAHRYRGIFGSQVANVIRRLRRICRHYGSNPVFILASATAAQTQFWGADLIGEPEPLAVVSEDTSRQGKRTTLLWKPSDSTAHDAADLMADLTNEGNQVITFAASRNQAELIALRAAKYTDAKIASYRGGYLAADRRAIENGLANGTIAGVAATNALELGIDIAGMDAVLIAGFPGTLASFRQQSGRASRSAKESLVIFLANDDPLDAYFLEHPELMFNSPVETGVLNASNPHVLAGHLGAAAQELPLSQDDERWFGPQLEDLANQGVAAGLLRRRTSGWYWVREDRAVDFIDLRGSSAKTVEIIERDSGGVIGDVNPEMADRAVHTGAIYLHQGQQWLVTDYRPDEGRALVRRTEPAYYTQPKSNMELTILSLSASSALGLGTICHGQVQIASQVTGFLRRDLVTNDVWDQSDLDLPVRTFNTHAFWWTLKEQEFNTLHLKPGVLNAGAHASAHLATSLLPVFASCDRWDIGGFFTQFHPQTGGLSIFVYDGSSGGAGFTERGYQVAQEWTTACLDRLVDCHCESGCPACIVSPRCATANQMLDKQAAIALLKLFCART